MAKRGPKPIYHEGTRWLSIPLPAAWARLHLSRLDRHAVREVLEVIRSVLPDGWPPSPTPPGVGLTAEG